MLPQKSNANTAVDNNSAAVSVGASIRSLPSSDPSRRSVAIDIAHSRRITAKPLPDGSYQPFHVSTRGIETALSVDAYPDFTSAIEAGSDLMDAGERRTAEVSLLRLEAALGRGVYAPWPRWREATEGERLEGMVTPDGLAGPLPEGFEAPPRRQTGASAGAGTGAGSSPPPENGTILATIEANENPSPMMILEWIILRVSDNTQVGSTFGGLRPALVEIARLVDEPVLRPI